MSLYDPIARLYDAETRDYLDDLGFYLEMARRAGGPILDAMCGSGRLLIPLAEQGYAVTGCDLSPAMLELAQARAAAAGVVPQVTLVAGDLCRVSLPEQQFSLAFVAINSFMHLERTRDQLAALATLHRALQADGVLILDLLNPDPITIVQDDNRLLVDKTFTLDGQQVLKLVASSSDPASQISQMTYIYDVQGDHAQPRRSMIQFALRWVHRYELEHLLHRAGFALRAVYGSYDLDEYTSTSERLIALAVPQRG